MSTGNPYPNPMAGITGYTIEILESLTDKELGMLSILSGSNNTGYLTTPICTDPSATTPTAAEIGLVGSSKFKVKVGRKSDQFSQALRACEFKN